MSHIYSTNLSLRPYQKIDKNDFLELFSNPQMLQYSDIVTDKNINEKIFLKILESIQDPEKKAHIWAVFLKQTANFEVFIGHCELKQSAYTKPHELEMVYFLNPAFWGKGYGTELVKMVMQFAFTHTPASMLIAAVDFQNIASQKVLQKAGFTEKQLYTTPEGTTYFWYKTPSTIINTFKAP